MPARTTSGSFCRGRLEELACWRRPADSYPVPRRRHFRRGVARAGSTSESAIVQSSSWVSEGNRARMRWGERLEFVAEAGPGDFIYVPPFVPHQEINASADEVLECVLVRSDGESVVVNLDIEPVEKPENVKWIDPIHRS